MELGFLSEILSGIINGIGFLQEFLLPKVGVGGGIEAKETVDIIFTLKTTLIFLSGIGLLFGFGLAMAAKTFAVKEDPRIEEVTEVLANAHCGACGYAGCRQYAEAVVTKPDVPTSLCTPGGSTTAQLVAEITGKVPTKMAVTYSRVMCQGDSAKSVRKYKYEGVKDCRAAVLAGGGDKSCEYGCLGFGTCVKACPFNAIEMNNLNLPVVNEDKCTGCKVCVGACPKGVLEVLPGNKAVFVACHSKDRGTDVRLKCQVGCIACGTCAKTCPFEAITVEENLAKIDVEKCRACGLCVQKCPTKAILDYVPVRSKAYIVEDNCIGCNMCMKVCPVNAAEGELKKLHYIYKEKCIGCGICVSKCPKKTIKGTFNEIKEEEPKKDIEEAA